MEKDILRLIIRILRHHPDLKTSSGEEVMVEPPEQPALNSLVVKGDPETIKLNSTAKHARPPFDWQAEVSLIEGEDMTHYLVEPSGRLVRTWRKEKFPVDQDEANELKKKLTALAKDLPAAPNGHYAE